MSDNEPSGLLAFQEFSHSIASIAGAMAAAQGEMTGAIRDSTNPHFKNRYADLESTWDAIRAPLSKHGIAVFQYNLPSDNGITVVTTLAHKSGEWIRGSLHLPVSKNDAQGYGSAMTYARRYSLQAMCGIAPIDDDGNAAAAAKPVHTTDISQVAAWKKAIVDSNSKERLQGIESALRSNSSLSSDEKLGLSVEIEKKKKELSK